MKMNGKPKVIIGSFLFTLLFLLIAFLVILPEIRGIAKDAQDLLSQRKEAVKNKAEENNIRDFQVFSSAHRLDMNRLANLLIDPQNPTSFLIFLDRIATESNFALKIVPGSSQKLSQDAWPSIPFQISSEGSTAGLRAFLQKLEYAPYLLEFKDLSVKVQKSATSKESMNFSLSLKLYTK